MHRLDTRPFEEIDPRRRERVLALARALSGEGEARLGLGKAVPRRFARLLRAAGRMDCGEDEALRRLAEAGPRLLSRMREAAGEAPLRLPAHEGAPRLLALLRALLVGEPTLTEEGLIAALHAFDEAQPLWKIFAIPGISRSITASTPGFCSPTELSIPSQPSAMRGAGLP